MNKRIKAGFMSTLLIISSLSSVYAQAASFVDVDESSEYSEAISYAVDHGFLEGINDEEFQPNNFVTRSEFISALGKIVESMGRPIDGNASFTDLEADDTYQYIIWAASQGIVSGYGDGTFGGEDYITREQAATILVNFSNWTNTQMKAVNFDITLNDWEEISSWAKSSVAQCLASDILFDFDNAFNPNGTITRAEFAKLLEHYVPNVNQSIGLSVTSDIFGNADTNNKSTLKQVIVDSGGPGFSDPMKFNEDGEWVFYEGPADQVTHIGSAVLTIDVSDIDDSKIDSSNATVQIVAGDGYEQGEFILHATTLDGDWKNGSYVYTLKTGDIEISNYDYTVTDTNSGREWSCFGGDGNGVYTFNLQVSGIKYDNKEVSDQSFNVVVYIWGREAADIAEAYNSLEKANAVQSYSNETASATPIWFWSGAGTLPILCDNLADDFYVT